MLIIKCCKLTYARIPEWLYCYKDYKTLETVIMLPDRSEFRVPMNIYYTIEEIEDE